jgi:hemerythrin
MLWTKNLETGIAKIDEQHKELFVQAEKLLDRSQQARVPETLEFLKNYVVKHFTEEESIQRRAQYPKSAFHHNLHVDFVNKFKKLYEEYKVNGEKLSVILAINSMVVNWLKDHIMVHDKEFGQFFMKQQAQQKK